MLGTASLDKVCDTACDGTLAKLFCMFCIWDTAERHGYNRRWVTHSGCEWRHRNVVTKKSNFVAVLPYPWRFCPGAIQWGVGRFPEEQKSF